MYDKGGEFLSVLSFVQLRKALLGPKCLVNFEQFTCFIRSRICPLVITSGSSVRRTLWLMLQTRTDSEGWDGQCRKCEHVGWRTELISTKFEHVGWRTELISTKFEHVGWRTELISTKFEHVGWRTELISTKCEHVGWRTELISTNHALRYFAVMLQSHAKGSKSSCWCKYNRLAVTTVHHNNTSSSPCTSQFLES